jgi:hypothetical protein
LKDPTDVLAAPHEAGNHPFGGLLIKALVTFVYQKYPIWDLHGFKHEFVDPSKCVLTRGMG